MPAFEISIFEGGLHEVLVTAKLELGQQQTGGSSMASKTTTYLPAAVGRMVCRLGVWEPTGKLEVVRRNPELEEWFRDTGSPGGDDEHPWAFRCFVGLDVAGEHGLLKDWYSLDDVIQVIDLDRQAQGVPPDATLIRQKGLFTYAKGAMAGKTGVENSVQVIVFWNPAHETLDEWKRHMKQVAEDLVTKLRQELVIIEFQRSGIVVEQGAMRAD